MRVFTILGLVLLAGCAADSQPLFQKPIPPPRIRAEASTPAQASTPTNYDQAVRTNSVKNSRIGAPHPQLTGDGQMIRPNSVKSTRMGLADAVTLIIMRHPDIMRANAVLARSKADIGTAQSVWYPQLSYQAGLGPNTFSGTGNSNINSNVQGPGVALNQQIWDFGRSAGAIRSAKATESQRREEVVVTADKLAEKGALAFIDVKRYEALAAAAAKNTAALKDLRNRIQDRVTAGTSDKSDLMLADVRIEAALGEEVQAKSSLMAAKVLLATLTGVMAEGYDDPAPVINKLAIRNEEPAFGELPTVAAADQAEKAAAAKIKSTKAEIYPTIGVQLGYNRNNYVYTQNHNAYTALLTIGGNLFQPGHKYAVQAAEEDRRAAEAAKNSAILDIRGRALASREKLIGGQQRIAIFRRQERSAIAASRIFFESYTLGKRTLSELLDTQMAIYQAANNRITAEYDVMAARVQYENVYGQLRQSLGVTATLAGE